MKIDKSIIKVSFLPIIALICGVVMLGIGIYKTAADPTDDYEKTVGYFYDSVLNEKEHYDSVKNENSAATYNLIYKYTVDGKEYMITTDYSTSFVPSSGTEIAIMYNPQNPDDAIIGGPTKENNILILLGIFFILCSIPFIAIIFFGGKGKKEGGNQRSIDLIGIIFGSISSIVGYGALCIICGSFSPVGIIKYFASSFAIPIIIPLLLIAAGVFLVIKSMFFYKSNNN